MNSKPSKRQTAGPKRPRAAAPGPLTVTWLESGHARLRPIEAADVPLIRRCLRLPPAILWPWLVANRSRTLDAGWLARFALDPNNPALVIENRVGRARGMIAIRVEGTRATLAVALADSRFWREECASEAVALMARAAFRILPLQRIELPVFAGCQGAVRCARKAGFRQEGVLRRCRRSQRSFEDCVVMSVLHA